MNRRNFLGTLATIPLVGAAMKVLAITPKPLAISTYHDPWNILTPEEISQQWVYVNTPTFVVEDKNFCIKTYKLNLCLDEYHRESFLRQDYSVIPPYKILAKIQIGILGLTHVHSVKFCEYPIFNVITGMPACYNAFARGAIVKV